jgi:hypothetical protein
MLAHGGREAACLAVSGGLLTDPVSLWGKDLVKLGLVVVNYKIHFTEAVAGKRSASLLTKVQIAL